MQTLELNDHNFVTTLKVFYISAKVLRKIVNHKIDHFLKCVPIVFQRKNFAFLTFCRINLRINKLSKWLLIIWYKKDLEHITRTSWLYYKKFHSLDIYKTSWLKVFYLFLVTLSKGFNGLLTVIESNIEYDHFVTDFHGKTMILNTPIT